MHKLLTLGLASLFLVATGCQDTTTTGPLAGPNFDEVGDDHDDDDFEGPFMATFDFTAPPTDPGESEVVDGELRVRGQVNEGPFIGGDVEGTVIAVTDVDIDLATGAGSGRGSFTFEVTKLRGHAVSGGWQGRFEGQIIGPVFSDDFSGRGFGDLEETRIEGNFSDFATGVDNIFKLVGLILEDEDDDDEDEDDDDDDDDGNG